jgi:nucleoside permease NupC
LNSGASRSRSSRPCSITSYSPPIQPSYATCPASACGILVFLVLVWLFSEDRKRIPWRTLLAGIVLQFVLAGMLLWLPPFKLVFMGLNELLLSLEQATRGGTSFVSGYLGGDELPSEEAGQGSSFILAFRALPLILLVSALSALLFYWGVLPFIVRTLSRLLQRAMGIGGALAPGAVTNVFVGMVPERRVEIIQLGMKSIAAGTLATCMTGAVIGVLFHGSG